MFLAIKSVFSTCQCLPVLKKNIYFWLCSVFFGAHGLSLVVVSRGYSLVAMLRLLTAVASLVVEHGLQSTGSGVVTQGLSCLSPCGVFPDQGLNSCPLHWQGDSQPLDHQGLPICLLFVLLRVFTDTCWLKLFLPSLYFTLHKWSLSLQIIISTKYCSPKQKATRSYVVCVHAKLLQSCPTLCNPRDCSLPGPSVLGILQARILEWLPCPPPKDHPDPGIRLGLLPSPVLAGRFFTTVAFREAPHVGA